MRSKLLTVLLAGALFVVSGTGCDREDVAILSMAIEKLAPVLADSFESATMPHHDGLRIDAGAIFKADVASQPEVSPIPVL